jgi:hypothetical protein
MLATNLQLELHLLTLPLNILSIWTKYKKFLAFTRAGFNSQLTLNCLGLLFRGKGLLAVRVRPIQSSFRSFSLNSFQAIAPLKQDSSYGANIGANIWGHFFKGAFLPQKWDLLPPF